MFRTCRCPVAPRSRPNRNTASSSRAAGGFLRFAGRSAVQKDPMAKKMLIDATHAEECRVVVVDGNKVDEFDFESVNKRQLAGNIYLA